MMKNLLLLFLIILGRQWAIAEQASKAEVLAYQQPDANTPLQAYFKSYYDHPSEAITKSLTKLEKKQINNRQIFWYEDFDLPNGTVFDDQTTAWSIEATNLGDDGDNYFEVRAGGGGSEKTLVARNTDGEVIWRSEIINIDGYSNVKVSADIRGNGPPDMDGHLQLYYILNDNGKEIPWINGLQRGRFAPTTAMVGELTGSTLQLIIKARNTTNNDYYKIDNIQVYTESNDRYAIQDGNWNDPNTWSYTIGGPSCFCIPDKLSNTHIIDGHTVEANTDVNTRNLTVYADGLLRWLTASRKINLWGNATLEVKNRGTIEQNNRNSIKFNHWNNEPPDGRPNRVDDDCSEEICPGVEARVIANDPTGFQAYELSLDAKGSFVIQGSGNLNILEDININHEVQVTNNLLGEIRVGKDLSFDYSNAKLTNNSTIIIAQNLDYLSDNGYLINNGDITLANSLTVRTPNGSYLTNYGSFIVKGNTNMSNNELIIENKGEVEMASSVVSAEAGTDEVKFYNLEGATWTFGGGHISNDILLFAGYRNNSVHYNGISDQIILTPRDADRLIEAGPYWHLQLSNKNAAGYAMSEKSFSTDKLDINGNLTIIGNETGSTKFDASNPSGAKNVYVGGNWEQQKTSLTAAQFDEGINTEAIIFDGASDQSVSNRERFNNLTVNKNHRRLFIQAAVDATREVALQQGIVAVDPSYIFTFESGATVTAVSGASHIVGKVLKKGNTNFSFPIGDGINYRPISISSLNSTSDFTAQYSNAAPPHADQKPEELANLGACGYWEMSSSNALATGKVTLHWDADCPVDFSEVVIARWNGTAWEVIPGTPTGNNNVGSITTNVVSSEFGLFTLAERTFAPVATDDRATTEEDTPLGIDVAFDNASTDGINADTDANGIDPNSVTIVRQPQHGTVSVDPTTGVVTYVPEANYNNDATAPDTFTYTVRDTKGTISNEATVTIIVNPINDAPVAGDDQYVIEEGKTLNEQVLTNDYDIESDALTHAVLTSGPTSGELTFRPDGSFTYVPRRGFVGEDRFTYRVCESEAALRCDEAVVQLTVRVGPLAIPKGFSPNGDQVGDYWQLPGIRNYPGNTVTIFNRWGNIVFRAVGYDNDQTVWQGQSEQGIRMGGDQLPTGTYFYIIDLGNGQDPLSGYVVLKR